MKTKNILPILMASATLLSACANKEPVKDTVSEDTPKVVSSPSFHIEGKLPDIGEYSGKELIKYHKNASSTFIPSDDYGTLVPFTSRTKEYTNNEFGELATMTYSKEGICTDKGEIVLLPSDATVYYYDHCEDFPYITVTPYDEESFQMMLPSEQTLIPLNGKWSMTLPTGSWITGAGDGVVSVMKMSNPQNYNHDKLVCYDYDGELIYEKDGVSYAGEYSHGYINVSLDSDELRNSCYLDKNGAVASDMYRTCHTFNEHGIAYVYEYDAHSYLINTDFEKISDVYESIYFEEECIVARKDDYAEIFELDGTYIDTIITQGKYANIHGGGKQLIYSISSKDGDVYKKLDGKDFVNDEGNAPNTYSSVPGYFVHKDEKENISTIFDADGNILAKLENCNSLSHITPDEKLIVYQKGSYDFEEFVDGRPIYTDPIKTVVYDVENQKDLLALDGSGGVGYEKEYDGRYITLYTYNDLDFMGGVSKYYLFDTENKELVFENCYNITHTKIGQKEFYSVVTQNFCTLYDGNFNKILRIINE